MKPYEKDSIEYALHIYDIYWDYYKKTLDERNQILNNYIIFVGIPSSIIGIMINKIMNHIKDYFIWIALVFIFILVLGVIIYDTYVVESFISERYIKKINHVAKYLIENHDKKYKNVFSENYNLNDVLLDTRNSQIHRVGKSFIIIILNTMILVSIFCLFYVDSLKWYYIFLPLAGSVFVHMIIFKYRKKELRMS